MWWGKRTKTLKQDLRDAQYDSAVAENMLRDAAQGGDAVNTIVDRLLALRKDNNWAPAIDAAFADKRFGGKR